MKRLVTMLTRHRTVVVAILAMSAGAWGQVVLAQDDDPFPPKESRTEDAGTKDERRRDAEEPPPPPTPDDLKKRSAEATEVDTPPADRENAETPEVLARGPIHEAFAESVVFDPKPGLIINKKPPADVPELPPEQKPDETDTVWIPGYWAWDDDRDDFLWVSGVWRRIPQGRQWVAGYWAEVPDDGSGEGIRYQWVAGHWAAADADEVEYLPPPPPTLEEGPNVPAPSADYVWQPGCWMWGGTQYNWRAGFWAASNPNWLWVPPYYCWTPRGYIFTGGYWDYGLNRRGICFAPVYFNSPFYMRRGYYYSPLVAFNVGLFNRHLFLRPGYNHYYFGDYYASRYQQGGIYPWFAYHNRHFGYDPFYVNARARFGGRDRDWERRIADDFERRRDNERERPPHTFAQMKQQMGAGKGPDGRNARDGDSNMLLASLDTLAKNTSDTLKLRSLDEQQRRDVLRNSEQWEKWRNDRRAAETAADVREKATARQRAAELAGKGKTSDPAAVQPDRAKLPKSPFASKVAPQGKGDNRKGNGRVELGKPAIPDDAGKDKGGNRRRPDIPDRAPDFEKGIKGPAGKGPGLNGESKTPPPKGPNAAPRFQGPQGSGGPGGREPKTPPPKGPGSAPRFQGPQGSGGPGGREPKTPPPKGSDSAPRFQGPQGGGKAPTPGGGTGPRLPGVGGGGGQRPPTPAPRLNVPSTPSVPRVAPSAPSVVPRAPSTPSIPRGPGVGGGGGGAPRIAPAPSGPRGGGSGVPRGGGGGGAPRGGGEGRGGDGGGRGRGK